MAGAFPRSNALPDLDVAGVASYDISRSSMKRGRVWRGHLGGRASREIGVGVAGVPDR